METAYIALIILAIVYVPIWLWVILRPEAAARYHLVKYGPLIMIKSGLGMRTMDRLARYQRFWRAFGFASKVISFVLLLLMLFMLALAIINLPSRLGSPAIGIQYALAIPGFNPILPITYGILALCVALVVHEMGHGIQTRANGARVDSTGLLYGVVPWGAFVEPNEEDMKKQPRRVQMDMYTAGISVNTFVAVLCMGLMVFSFTAVDTQYGDSPGIFSVADGSPIDEAGIPASALIVGIYDSSDNTVPFGVSQRGTVVGLVDYEDSRFDPTQRYRLKYYYQEYQEDNPLFADNVQLGAFVSTVTKDSPAHRAGLAPGELLYSLTTSTQTYRIGTSVGFSEVMAKTVPGEVVTLTTVTVDSGSGHTVKTYADIELGKNGSVGFLGVGTNDSGMGIITPDLMKDRAINPFFGCDTPFSYVQGIFTYFSGPFNGSDPMPDAVKWWYDVPFGDIFWILMSCLYWIFWLDLLLAITNALPAYPFDGGYIFAGGTEWLLEKLRVGDEERRKALSSSIARSVSTISLFMFILVFMAVIIRWRCEMIDIYAMKDGRPCKTDEITDDVWINLTNPEPGEIEAVHKALGIDSEAITAALDDEEGSRVEVTSDYTLILIDAPTREWRNGREEFTTYPISITITDRAVVTVCLQELFAISNMVASRNRYNSSVNVANRPRFVLQILFRIAMNYQADLKYIEVKRTAIEESIRKFTKREDLFELHELESNLVYFKTSLSVNASIIDRVGKQSRFVSSPEDRDLLDDVVIETNQALEMTTTYSQIIKGTRQLVEADLNNSLSNVMKFLTSITLIIAIPTMIASFYGMNVSLPGQDYQYMPYILLAVMGVLCLVSIFILRRRGLWR